MPQISMKQKETGSDDADIQGGVQVFGCGRIWVPTWPESSVVFNSKETRSGRTKTCRLITV